MHSAHKCVKNHLLTLLATSTVAKENTSKKAVDEMKNFVKIISIDELKFSSTHLPPELDFLPYLFSIDY